jgi:predicted CxxxxCH...CXXCH cytochrome family protein
MSNVCNISGCHDTAARGGFTADKASNALGNHPSPPSATKQTSHFWGGAKTTQPAAGASNPPTSFYSSRYSISTNRITCSICHDPHKEIGTNLLRKTTDGDLICQQCHTGLYKDYTNAILTHPVGTTASYATALQAFPTKYKATPASAATGVVGLINGVVSCSSCHAPHFADSKSSTSDGLAVAPSLVGDGHMLKANGPFESDNSVLCQTCHTYQAHGKVTTTTRVGCLTCHSGHIVVGNSNVYVLRNSVTIDGTKVPDGTKSITYTTTTTSWNDNVAGTAAGYCEVCHGSAETIPKGAQFHLVGAICRDCHMHQVDGGTYSFQNDANAATCGDCHGFPPYQNVRGDRNTGGVDGGYAYANSSHHYLLDASWKDESKTPHNAHAGGGLAQGGDYIFGTGIVACDPCHDGLSQVSSHDTTTNPGSYRDLAWNSLSRAGTLLNPLYQLTTPNQWTCSAVYCHSNGGKRNASGTKVLGDYSTVITPSWLNGSNPRTLIGAAGECAVCHGNTSATMTTRSNSASHGKHLGGGSLLKTYSCSACHNQTATSNTALAAGARLISTGGKHVNGVANVVFNSTFNLGNGTLGVGNYNPGNQGTCTTYCHSNGKGSTVTVPDWDLPASGACGACHSTDAAALSAPHAKHLAIATVTCNDCHEINATLGTHTGHVDGVFTFLQTACNSCHGYEATEKTPVWGEPMDNAYCMTCHAGATTGDVKGKTAPSKQHAATRGHNRTTNYTSGNLPGNKLCTSCHLTSIPLHVDGNTGNASGLNAAAATCTTTCHGPSGSAVKDGIVTHVSKSCTACHDPHGDTTETSNIYMVRSKSTGNYASDATPIVFTNRGNDAAPLTATNSYDEDDNAAGNAGEVNADDFCATCHTVAGGSSHNNRDNTPTTGSHHQGETCMTATCHKPHTEATGAFKPGGGSACNSCHDYPPNTGAHGDGSNKHSRVSTPNKDTEDRSDCAYCHTGADLYTYDLGADSAAGGARANHGVGDVNQKNVLVASVGYNLTNFSCATACHLSTVSDGAWNDVNGLNCNACHYYVAGATSNANNTAAAPKDLKGSHNAHFAKTKPCTACHVVPTDTTHISVPTGTDIQKIQSRAAALQNEADVLGTLAIPIDPGNETCSGTGIGLGCHNTKTTPAWTTTGITCTNCHTAGGASAADPVSGLHVGPITVSGKVHNSTLGSGCANCHSTLTAQSTHFNALFEGGNGQKTQMGLFAAYTQTANDTGTCLGAGVATGCHSDAGTWARRWSTTARDTTGVAICANCHGTFAAGWNSGVVHAEFVTRGSGHSATGSLGYPCTDCHVIGASTNNYLFTLGSNDWKMVEAGTTKHGDNLLQMNSTDTGFSDAAARTGCANSCHGSDSSHDFGKSTLFTTANAKLVLLAGVAPQVTCYNCHGGMYSGSAQSNYWPDKDNSFEGGGNLSEDNKGRHDIHMQRLAQSVYNEDYLTELLANNTAKNPALTSDAKQKVLCDYCHDGASNHGNKTNLPAQITTMYNLWLPKTADSNALWSAASSGSCSDINCHNSKATTSVANFDWYGTGTQNCLLCHNDITVTTAGTTGATHQAHVGAAAAAFGKVINCASCHGGSVTWSPYAAPASNHINGAFNVGTAGGGSVSFDYTGSYTDAATRTVGNCGTNLCHNNGKNAATPAYTWQTAVVGCDACHATTATLGSSHDPHLNASFAATFGRTIVGCGECHDAASASDMTARTAHMDGSVNLKAGITYSGTPATLTVGGTNTYGACSASVCHQNGKGANITSPAWNRTPTPADNCTICHATAPATGRHVKHLANTAYVSSCGSCHVNATTTTIGGTTHMNGSVNTGAAITGHTAGDADCTNTCHVVNAATSGDWNDSNVLACLECHFTAKVGAVALPLSGLHAVTPRVSGKKHDATVHANGCEVCHTTIRAATTTHIKGNYVADGAGNTDRGLFAAYSEAAIGSCLGSGVNLAAGCHRDNGDWGRKWATSVTANDGSECANCHGGIGTGYAATGWVAGIVPNHLANWDGDATSGEVMTGHSVCKSCHGFNGAADKDDNYVLTNIWNQGGADTSMHGNSKITMNGGTNYNAANYGCDNAGCHGSAAAAHALADSAWTVELGAFAAGGSCYGCHGNGSNQYWPDGTVYPDRAGAHAQHIPAIAAKMAGGNTLTNRNATCDYCHPGGVHSGDQSAAPADVCNTDSDNNGTPETNTLFKMKKIIGGGADNSGFYRSTPGTCSVTACHASAPFTPHWYADTVAPGNTTIATAASAEPGSVKLTWTAPGDDGNLDGTAYRYDLRYSPSSITAGTFDAATQAKVPTVDRMGKAQSIIVNGLNPGATYYFALKTYDEANNVSAMSNVVSRAAQADNVAPVFWGINSVSTGDESFDMTPNPDTNSVYVSWDAGRDHSHSLTTPLNYLVLWSEYSLRTHFNNGISGGPMPSTIGTDACFDKSKTGAAHVQFTCGTVVPATNEYRIKSAQTTALGYNVTGLPVGTVYNFLVRAKDASGNIDSNRADMMAMAKSTPYKTIALQTKYTSATIPVVSTGWTTPSPFSATSASDAPLGNAYPGTQPGTFSLAANATAVFSPGGSAGANYTVKTNVWGLNYQMKVTGSTTGATTLTYSFGYLTGKTFTALGTAKTMSIARRAPIRVVKFPLSAFKGTIPVGSKPAFILKGGAYAVTLTYGSIANKGGILLYNEQEYNDLPTGLGGLAQSTVTSSFVGGDVRRLTWNAANPVNAGQTVHYDVFVSTTTNPTPDWQYVVGRNLTTNTVDWDPVGDGITGNLTNVKFKVMAGDGFREGDMLIDGSNSNNENHSVAVSSAFSVNNSTDIWTPAAITTLAVETRPKQGSVNLTWKAVGNDGFNHGTRATQYDIRYSTANITEGTWAAATPAVNEPKPDFTGAIESYELLGLNPDATYYFAMKVGDMANNWSGLSNVVSTLSGPKCGICHSTPPDESATAGNHVAHGYTKADCGNCHGLAAANFNTSHQDGILSLGWKTASPVVGVINDTAGTVTYTQNGTLIYSDTVNGVGGFNQTAGGTTKIDDGTCSGFNGTNASGCHGPATPKWDVNEVLACSACHGMSGRTNDQYGRPFDATLDNAGIVPDQVLAAPALDNHGGSTGKYVGAHLKHLNSSFRLAKGDNCKLCHNDSYHADSTVDVAYDLNVTGAGALWTPNATGAGTPGTCGGTSVDNCHGSNVPSWDSAATVACNLCHGFGGLNYTVGAATSDIGHVKDGTQVRACTWCHPSGHPQGTVQDPNSIMIPNNPLVGIAYRSGGIHLLKNINARGLKTTEAEICWACHDAQATKITEWGANNRSVTGNSPYNYGNLFATVAFGTPTSNWLGTGTGAYWQSGTTAFQTIKNGKIQSTHSTAPGGTSTVTYDATNKRYNESLDAVAELRCSNCHDVHNMNKAENDTVVGSPYLRGTWMGNPYAEDGPPLAVTTYANTAMFGAVPRGATTYRYLGGYFIDQNNAVPGTPTTTTNGTLDDYPTAGWTQETSAGLCILCHGNDVDNMDQKTGESLWLGSNGHSNSAIGGTFTNAANIFDTGTGTAGQYAPYSGRPTPVIGTTKSTQVPDMAYQAQAGAGTTTAYGYRAQDSAGGMYTPVTTTRYAHASYDWGATIDATSNDLMYHQFSCSKCHNPHASRLPKLLITNCLDIQHNTWDDNKTKQTLYTSATLAGVDRYTGGNSTAYFASAQNCHRYNDKRANAGQVNAGGWNKVTPWTTANQ